MSKTLQELPAMLDKRVQAVAHAVLHVLNLLGIPHEIRYATDDETDNPDFPMLVIEPKGQEALFLGIEEREPVPDPRAVALQKSVEALLGPFQTNTVSAVAHFTVMENWRDGGGWDEPAYEEMHEIHASLHPYSAARFVIDRIVRGVTDNVLYHHFPEAHPDYCETQAMNHFDILEKEREM